MSGAVASRAPGRTRTPAPVPLSPAIVLAGLMLVSAALLLYAGRHLTFFYDEWTFVFTRRGESVGTYLDPHNGHLSLLPVIVYKVLFKLFGLRHYAPFRAVGVALHLACAGMLFVLVRRRLGAWAALVPTTLLLFMGTAWQDLLWPFQIGYLGSIAAGLAAMALLENRERHHDGLACGLLVVSIASSSVGIPFLVGAAVLLIASRQPARRLWIVAAPALLYVIWYAGWGTSEQTSTGAVLAAPQYVADAAAGAVSGIAGLSEGSWGPPLLVALLTAMTAAWQIRRAGSPSAALLAVAAASLAFWVLTAVVRAGEAEPFASRYLYVTAPFILIATAETLAGLTIARGWWPFAGILLAGALLGNINALRQGERGLRGSDASVRASLSAVQIAAPVVSPAFVPDPANAPQITAGPYLTAVRDLGSPALSLSELTRSPEPTRANADTVLQRAEAIAEAPTSSTAAGAGTLPVAGSAGGTVEQRGSCQQFRPSARGGYVDVIVRPGANLVIDEPLGSSPVVYLRRFASEYQSAPLESPPPGGPLMIRFPSDLAPQTRWQVRLSLSKPALLCLS